MRLSAQCILLIALAVSLAEAQPSSCTPTTTAEFKSEDGEHTGLDWYFGSKEGGGSTLYNFVVKNHQYTFADYYFSKTDGSALNSGYSYINQVPIIGGREMVDLYGIQPGFVPTANFTCLSDSSAIWGPSYPDYRREGGRMRGRYPNLEVYTQFSAPNETSYVRTIYFIKNTGATAERVRLFILTTSDNYETDRSPIDNNQRYYTAFAFEEGDKGYNNTNPAAIAQWPYTLHARGQKALDQTSTLWADPFSYYPGVVYTTVLGAGEQFAYMHISSIGRNVTTALKTAAEIDAEPAHIFHDLTVDQLAMIRNWGGCQVIIGPTSTVTVTPPAQCSSGLTSDFTVQANSTRTDLTTGFTHRVVGIQNIELVAAQSSTTLSVPNGAGAVRHQLWYKECLVKETAFTACTKAAPPVAPVAKTPSKVSDASSLAVASTVLSLISAVSLF